MSKKIQVKFITYSLIIIPTLWIAVRYISNTSGSVGTGKSGYMITYKFWLYGDNQDYQMKTFLPVNNFRQDIRNVSSSSDHTNYNSDVYFDNINKRIRWEGIVKGKQELSCSFHFDGKPLSYEIKSDISYLKVKENYVDSLNQSVLIQSKHEEIVALSKLLVGEKTSIQAILNTFFDHVKAIPEPETKIAEDAMSVLQNGTASQEAKTRLFVALCQSAQIPARVIVGLNLMDKDSKAPYLCAEVNLGANWVPFDIQGGHFAGLPTSFVELYVGDYPFLNYQGDLLMDYNIVIEKEKEERFAKFALIDLWGVLDKAHIPYDYTRFLILLPLGAFLVAISKNVVGFKTYGVFLPVLIASALVETGVLSGVIFLSMIILLISLVNFPLDYWGILHTPKLVVMLTLSVIFYLVSVIIFVDISLFKTNTAFFFPIIILTITAERFSRKVDEEGIWIALQIYVQTLWVILICYAGLSSSFIQRMIITFPEILVVICGLSILLGKWIGLRITEYKRFYLAFKL